MLDYWPFNSTTTKVFISQATATPMIIQRTQPIICPNRLRGFTMQSNDGDNKWISTWHVMADPLRGAMEYQNDFPEGVSSMMAPSYEIPWGSPTMRVAELINQPIKVDVANSKNYSDKSSNGRHAIRLTRIIKELHTVAGRFNNVLELHWWQYWETDAPEPELANYAGIYYLAPGIGVVQINMTQPPNDVALLSRLTA